MDIRNKMKPAFSATKGGLFSSVTKADVGGGYLELGEQGVALMGWADPFYPKPAFPPHVQQALIDAINTGFPAHYTPPIGNDDLKREIAKKLYSFNQLDVDPLRNILITPGSDLGLFYSILPFVGPGTDVMVIDPSYPNNFQVVKLLGGNVISVPVFEENGFQPKIEDFESHITPATKLIVLTNPNNPTTTVLRKEFLEQLATFAIKHDLVCVVDQAFEESVFDDIEYVTLASLPGMFERTITVFSVSKGMALSGLRVGYIVADDRAMDVLYGAAVAVIGATNTASQMAVIEAFRNNDFVQRYNKIFDERRRIAYDIFNSVPGIKMLMPEAGFFSWVNVSAAGTGDSVAADLIDKRIAAINGGAAYGEQGRDYIRIIHGSLGSNQQVYESLMRIAEELHELINNKNL